MTWVTYSILSSEDRVKLSSADQLLYAYLREVEPEV